MGKLRVLSIFGTRPEAVKMAPVVKALRQSDAIDSYVCVTAQHRQMLDQVLSLFQIVPDMDLNLMQPNQTLAALTARIFTKLEPVLLDVKPDWVLVQGDTTTVMASALLSYYHKIRIGHVEAGLRTGNKWQPFPEEVNRKVAGVVADLHFAPTDHSRQNLLKEGVPDWRIAVTGNPVIDSLNEITSRQMPQDVFDLLNQMDCSPEGKRLVLVTAHRRENFGKPLENICAALRQLAEQYSDHIHLVYPVHLNPNVKEPVHRLLADVPNITLLSPLDYLPLVHLMKNAYLVLTDSGGIQEEATALGIPTLVLRSTTERPEGVEAGVLKLVGTDTENIFNHAQRLLEDQNAYSTMASSRNPFGDGHASERIVDALLKYEDRQEQ